MGRLVHTHSTYVEGLILILRKLAKDTKILTITPGVISKVRSNSNNLTIKITREVKGGHKLVARKGRSAQEIYILTSYTKEELEKAIENNL